MFTSTRGKMFISNLIHIQKKQSLYATYKDILSSFSTNIHQNKENHHYKSDIHKKRHKN